MSAGREVGNSGMAVAPFALGGNVFGWTADEATSFRLLDAFVDAGGTMIDTADVYSAWAAGHVGGESETVIGAWLKRDPAKRDKVVIASKVGMMAGLAPDTIAKACDGSLARLGIDTIDLYYQHQDDAAVPLADSLGAFETLRQAGKIRATGLSNFSAERVIEALDTADANGLAPAVAVQGWYNLVERAKYEGALQDVVVARGLSFFSFYSVANGFLTGKYRTPDDLSQSVRGGRNIGYLDAPRGQAVLAALDAISAQTGAALSTIALAWLKVQPGVTAPIASATRMAQLDELLASLSFELSPAQRDALDAASA